jgi:NAD+ synthase (glutamine-hydrolysing)
MPRAACSPAPAAFPSDVTVVDLAKGTGTIAPADFEPEAEVWSALVLGVRDYARKTHFRQVLLGLSGGIDSALTAAIAADAMGPRTCSAC